MTPFRTLTASLAPLLRPNVDTDAIIPSREMKRVSKEGLGEGLFAPWRYLDVATREPNPDFVLNQPAYREAEILATGPNFGCGSSREHAVWALQEFGIRAILAPSFGAIFERNCYNNGVLPVVLEETLIVQLVAAAEPDPAAHPLTIDLERQVVGDTAGNRWPFTTPALQRELLLNGWDPIDQTLQLAKPLADFERKDRMERPWVYDLAPKKIDGRT